jgi:class 3 adenylate cyclase
MTVMFCDLVGSTALSSQLDVEELRDLITGFQDACVAQVARFDGFVARYMGDGLLVYFGYPRAHEDSAERAVRAGLAIVNAVAALGTDPVPRQVRVGIATGRVVVGDLIGEGASAELAVVGETPNLAARLQALAEPGTVLISETTHHLVRDVFECEDLGPHELKGFAERVPAWRALREATQRASRTSDVPLVGRAFELKLLTDRWESASRGVGQVVSLVGESGTGKSALLAGFLEDAGSGAAIARYQCAVHYATTALHPVADHVGRLAGLELQDDADARRQKLREWVSRWSDDPERDTAATMAMLSLADADSGGATTPAEVRAEILESMWSSAASRAARAPLLLIFEDVQWADPTTLELIAGYRERASELGLLLLLTHRPDFDPPWSGREGLSTLTLGKLPPDDAAELIERVAGDRALALEVTETILSRADCVPGYITELTRAVVAALDARGEAVEARSVDVPATLHDSLAAQLDRLGVARDVAQIAAGVGREFSVDLLAHVYAGGTAQLLEHLDTLVTSGVVEAPSRDEPGARYSFRHALMRDVAYGSLLKSAQRALHLRIADVLLEQLPGAASAAPELVAHHLQHAGRGRGASEWWRRAADRASATGAFREWVAHCRAAVTALEPEVDAEVADDAALLAERLIDLAGPLRFVHGEAEAEALLERAEALATRHELSEILSAALFALGNLFFNRDPARSVAMHERSLVEARRSGSKRAEVRALGGLMDVALISSDVEGAIGRGKLCVELAEAHGFVDITAANAPIVAWCLHFSLRPDEAGQFGRLAIERATADGHVRGLLNARVVLALAAFSALDNEEAARLVGLIGESTGRRLPHVQGILQVNEARVLERLGEVDRARAVQRELHELVPRENPSWLLARAAGLVAIHPDDLDVAVTELLAGTERAMNNFAFWATAEAADALLRRGNIEALARFVEGVEPALTNRPPPRTRLWLRAAKAALWASRAPEDPAAAAELASVRQFAEEHMALDVGAALSMALRPVALNAS